VLADGRRAFFKGIYPPKGTGAIWMLDEEERVYRRLADRISPWAPKFLGSLRHEGWHAILLEDLGAADVPPWTAAKTRTAARGYADFHRRNLGARLPRWLPQQQWRRFSFSWSKARDDGLEHPAALAGRRRDEAREWLDVAYPVLAARAGGLENRLRRTTLMHFDTRADNLRVTGGRLRIFDWNWACPGPPEFDLAAFAQAVTADGGPEPERVTAWYRERLAFDESLLAASVAAIAGFFAGLAWRPPVKGLPRLRSIQRKQLKASLRWAARIDDLPEPRWLAAVRD
jgi:thiamine kinase-like enzyme